MRAKIQYRISVKHSESWIWAGDGDTDNGTTAQLPDAVYEAADAGKMGEIFAEGGAYLIEEL